MKKHSYILFILLLLCISNSFAQQNWQEMMYDTTKNFYDIQAAFYEGCGENYFCSGTYYHYSTNAAGCPHTDILYLNIE
jgi:hypothetical protein